MLVANLGCSPHFRQAGEVGFWGAGMSMADNDNPKQAAAQIKLGRWGSNRPVLPRGSNQALLLLLRVKRGLLYLYLLYQSLDPINCTLIVDPGRQTLVSLDLLVEFDAFFTHWYFPHSRVISIGCCLYDGEPAVLFRRFQIRPSPRASSWTCAYATPHHRTEIQVGLRRFVRDPAELTRPSAL